LLSTSTSTHLLRLGRESVASVVDLSEGQSFIAHIPTLGAANMVFHDGNQYRDSSWVVQVTVKGFQVVEWNEAVGEYVRVCAWIPENGLNMLPPAPQFGEPKEDDAMTSRRHVSTMVQSHEITNAAFSPSQIAVSTSGRGHTDKYFLLFNLGQDGRPNLSRCAPIYFYAILPL
jgi:hypothetical protein